MWSILDGYYPVEISFLPVISPFRFLVTVMLSASTTDRQAAEAAEALFSSYPDAAAIAAADADSIEALIRRAGLAHMDAMSLGRNPLVFVLGSAQGNAHGLASALATEAPQGVAGPSPMLAWHFSDTLSLIVPDPAHLSLKDGTFRQGFERTLDLLKGHNPAEPVSAILVVLSVRELAGIDQDGMGAGMASGLADRELTERKGYYYRLVRNQLELGN